MTTASEYVLGHASPELERLQLQAQIIGRVTRRLIRESGIAPGLRVLEIGCGAGDVSLLLAEAVGPDGRVVAFDREARAIETARSRTAAAGFTNIEFLVAADEAMPTDASFDAAFGRYVLIHQPDPVAMIRRAAQAVRPGGIVAFHEVALHVESQTHPPFALSREIDRCVSNSFRTLLPHHDVGGRFFSCFAAAGLPPPQIIWESVVADHTSPVWRWVAMNYHSMLPHIVRIGLNPVEEADVDALAARLQAAAAEVGAQFVSRPQSCAWSRRI